MKTLLTWTILTITVLHSYKVHCQEFNHFRLKGALKELAPSPSFSSKSGVDQENGKYLKRNKLTTTRQLNNEKKHYQKTINKVIAERLLELKPSNKSIIEDEVPPLLQKIMDLLGTRYQQIGNEQTQPLLLSRDLGGGVLNFSGFSWQKPLANFGVWADREIAPDLFSGRWIVHDTLGITISATTLLTALKEEDLIDIDEDSIGAFAGINFQRKYHYYHFSQDYIDGLTSDYSKLFLSFTKFNINQALNMAPYELMKKEDQFSFNAGGFVNSPSLSAGRIRAGVLTNIALENELIVQYLGEADQKEDDEFLRVSVNKKLDISASAHLSLQVDFFNLLKLTLLSYDLEYGYEKSNALHLSFYENDKQKIENLEPYKNEFKKLISGAKDEVIHWKDHIVQQDERMTQNLNSKYSVLILGKIRKTETQQVKIIKDKVEKVFFRHYSRSIKYIQNLWSRLFNTFIYKLFEWDYDVNKAAETTKKMTIEYEQVHNLPEGQVDSEKKFSVKLVQSFYALKTHRWLNRLYKKETIKHIKNWSTIENKIIDLITNESIRGPLNFESKIEIETNALTYLNNLDEHRVFEIIVDVCGSKRKSQWLNPEKRKKMLQNLQVGASTCVKTIGTRYLQYIDDYQHLGINDITKFRKFVGKFFSKAKNLQQIKNLFGEENVFVYGQLNAATKDGLSFSTHFKSGLFRGLGVIGNFMRQDAVTVPLKL